MALPFYEIDLIGRTIADSQDFQGTNPKGIAFDVFWVFARTHLENGNSIIFDMGRPSQWKKLKEVCDLVPNARLVTFILDCPVEVCVERFNNRTDDIPSFNTNVEQTIRKFN